MATVLRRLTVSAINQKPLGGPVGGAKAFVPLARYRLISTSVPERGAAYFIPIHGALLWRPLGLTRVKRHGSFGLGFWHYS